MRSCSAGDCPANLSERGLQRCWVATRLAERDAREKGCDWCGWPGYAVRRIGSQRKQRCNRCWLGHPLQVVIAERLNRAPCECLDVLHLRSFRRFRAAPRTSRWMRILSPEGIVSLTDPRPREAR